MSVPDVKSKGSPAIDFPMSNTEMVLEVASLLCIVISLAMVGIDVTAISVSSAILPAATIICYLLLSLAARYPNVFRNINDMASNDVMSQDRGTREMIFWVRTEIIWTILCIQGIWTFASYVTGGVGKILIMVLFAFAWLIINGSLLYFIIYMARSRSH